MTESFDCYVDALITAYEAGDLVAAKILRDVHMGALDDVDPAMIPDYQLRPEFNPPTPDFNLPIPTREQVVCGYFAEQRMLLENKISRALEAL